jgi:hypothetical protein
MPHSVAQWRGVGGAEAGHDSQVCSGMDSPLTRMPAGVSALNAPTGGAGTGAEARDALERDGNSLEGGVWLSIETGPHARGGGGSPARGSFDPRARRIPTRGGNRPTSEAGLYRGSVVPLERSGVLSKGGWAD